MTHLGVVVRATIASRQIIASSPIEIATQSAQLFLVMCRHRDLQEIMAIPFDGQSQLSVQHDAALGESFDADVVPMAVGAAAAAVAVVYVG